MRLSWAWEGRGLLRRGGLARGPLPSTLVLSGAVFYLAGAFHKAAGNTPLLTSATWEIEHHKNT